MTLHWRGHNLGPDSPIVKSAPFHQHHWEPNVGDRISAWQHVKPGESLDGNVTPACGELWFFHWGVPGPDGYHDVVDAHTGHVRRMNPHELHLPASHWGREGIKRWRDAHGQAPMTLLEGLRYAVKRGILIAMEVKGPAWAKANWCFAHLRAVCVEVGHPAWVKRLATLRFPRKTIRMAHNNHVQIAAIYGKSVRGRAKRLAHTFRLSRLWGRDKFNATW